MDKKFLLPAGLVAVAVMAGLVIFATLDTSERPPVASPENAVAPEQMAANYADLPASGDPVVSPAQETAVGSGPLAISSVQEALATDTARDETAREAVLDIIDEASVTYDVEGLAVLGPLLGHRDPEIREATVEGIIQLGETAGAKTLREAARTSGNPKEAARMIEAAQFLELPVFSPSAQ